MHTKFVFTAVLISLISSMPALAEPSEKVIRAQKQLEAQGFSDEKLTDAEHEELVKLMGDQGKYVHQLKWPKPKQYLTLRLAKAIKTAGKSITKCYPELGSTADEAAILHLYGITENCTLGLQKLGEKRPKVSKDWKVHLKVLAKTLQRFQTKVTCSDETSIRLNKHDRADLKRAGIGAFPCESGTLAAVSDGTTKADSGGGGTATKTEKDADAKLAE